jgi:hypothetical protein
MHYLDLHAWRDTYVVGNYAIAAIALKDDQHIARASASLAELAHREGGAMYWNLETNMSPFYGWGQAGRLETTALAVEALAMLSKTDASAQDQVSRGVQYLLSHKDPYRVWYSTHASEAVVEALAAAMPPGDDKGEKSRTDIVVNGRKATTIYLPAAKDVVGAIAVDLTQGFRVGANSLQVLRHANGTPMNAQAITSYYVAWRDSSATHGEAVERGDTRALKMKVHYDRTSPKIGEKVVAM